MTITLKVGQRYYIPTQSIAPEDLPYRYTWQGAPPLLDTNDDSGVTRGQVIVTGSGSTSFWMDRQITFIVVP
jgi:hypothetical protein